MQTSEAGEEYLKEGKKSGDAAADCEGKYLRT